MIYFQTNKRDKGLDFIDINIPSNKSQLNAYYTLRRSIFCEEQKIFKNSDIDEFDKKAIPIVAVNHYCGFPDKIVGVVRIYEATDRAWFGGRLGVVKKYRSFSKFVCPNLFNEIEIPALFNTSIAAGLIYRAVSLANYMGCDKFSAYVQEQNVKLFERLHWKAISKKDIYGVSHFLMEANLTAYPATPVYASSTINNKSLLKLSNVTSNLIDH